MGLSKFFSEISKVARINLIKKFLNHANVLKLAQEEATLFFEDENPLLISQQLSNRPDVIITDGKPFHGLSMDCRELLKFLLHKKLLIQLAQVMLFSWLNFKINLFGYPSNKLEIQDCIKFACVCGLLTCIGEGAIEQQPHYEKVNKFLGSLIS